MVKLVSLTFMPWSSADRRVCAHDRSRYPNRLLSTSAKPSVTYPNCWHLRIHLSDVHIPPSARTWAKSEVRGEYDHVETFPSFLAAYHVKFDSSTHVLRYVKCRTQKTLHRERRLKILTRLSQSIIKEVAVGFRRSFQGGFNTGLSSQYFIHTAGTFR